MTARANASVQDERRRCDRERKRKVRKAMRARGLRPYEVWVTADEWPEVKRYLGRLAKRREAINRGGSGG